MYKIDNELTYYTSAWIPKQVSFWVWPKGVSILPLSHDVHLFGFPESWKHH